MTEARDDTARAGRAPSSEALWQARLQSSALRPFGLCIPAQLMAEMVADAEAHYPREACGVGLGTAAAVASVARMENVQDALHSADPAWAGVGPRALLRVLLDARARGHEARLLYHAHCDAGPHLSDLDAAAAALWPGAVHVVLAVFEGAFTAATAYRARPDGAGFDAARLWPPDPAG